MIAILSDKEKGEVRSAIAKLMRERGPLTAEALDDVAGILAAYRDERRRTRPVEHGPDAMRAA